MVFLDIDTQALLELYPEHEKDDCDDLNFMENSFFFVMGTPMCHRCAVLHKIFTDEWPADYVESVSFTIRETVNASRRRR